MAENGEALRTKQTDEARRARAPRMKPRRRCLGLRASLAAGEEAKRASYRTPCCNDDPKRTRKPKIIVVLSFLVSLGPCPTRAPRGKRDTNLQRFGHLARPGPDGLKRESVSKPVSKPVSFLRARSISLSKTKSRGRSSPRGRVLTSFGSRKYFVEVTVPAPAILIGQA
jgi:hypothetical protein